MRYFRGDAQGKRAVAIWHRRAGKDSVALAITREQALRRVGTYWHMLPTLAQGRKVVWDGIRKDGQKVMSVWPDEIIAHKRNDEMKLELPNGSVWQVVGSDNFNSLVGSNPVGVVFSEYSLADPAAWDFIRPILAENGGWAMFIYTPRGKNHGYTLYQNALKNDDWHCEVLTADDTGSIPEDAIQAERDAGMPEEMIRQEFFCSFDAPLVGSIYGDQMFRAEQEGRVARFPHDEGTAVDTWWDLGRSDATAVWFAQHIGGRMRFIDYWQGTGKDLPDFAEMLDEKRRDKRYRYGAHIYPHDAAHKRLGMGGESIADQMGKLGYPGDVQPVTGDLWGDIQQVRSSLSRCDFDADNCALGLEALKSYSKEEDENRSSPALKYFREKPRHDWASHGCDAFRTGIVAGKSGTNAMPPLEALLPSNHVSRGVV